MVNAVNSNDASIWTFNESLPYQDLPKAIVASTSMPFAFPHMRFQGKEFIDGGSVWNIDFSTAVQRCEEIVGKDRSRITVDIILCSGKHKHVHKETEKWSTREIKQRLEELKSFYSTMNDVVEVKRAYPSVNFRYLVFPTEELPTFFIPLVFEKESMEKMIDIGLEDARKVIEHGPGANFEALTKMNDALYQKAKYLNYEDVIKEVLSEREALAKKMTE